MSRLTEIFAVTMAAIGIWTILSTLFEIKLVPQRIYSTLIQNNFMLKMDQGGVILNVNESHFETLIEAKDLGKEDKVKKWKIQRIGRRWSKEKVYKKVLIWKTRNMFDSKYYERKFPNTLNAKLDSILKGKCKESR